MQFAGPATYVTLEGGDYLRFPSASSVAGRFLQDYGPDPADPSNGRLLDWSSGPALIEPAVAPGANTDYLSPTGWRTVPSAVAPGGSTGQLQYNNGTTFAGMSGSVVSGNSLTLGGTLTAGNVTTAGDVTGANLLGTNSIGVNYYLQFGYGLGYGGRFATKTDGLQLQDWAGINPGFLHASETRLGGTLTTPNARIRSVTSNLAEIRSGDGLSYGSFWASNVVGTSSMYSFGEIASATNLTAGNIVNVGGNILGAAATELQFGSVGKIKQSANVLWFQSASGATFRDMAGTGYVSATAQAFVAQDYVQGYQRILIGNSSGGRLLPITDGVAVYNWAQTAHGKLQANEVRIMHPSDSNYGPRLQYGHQNGINVVSSDGTFRGFIGSGYGNSNGALVGSFGAIGSETYGLWTGAAGKFRIASVPGGGTTYVEFGRDATTGAGTVASDTGLKVTNLAGSADGPLSAGQITTSSSFVASIGSSLLPFLTVSNTYSGLTLLAGGAGTLYVRDGSGNASTVNANVFNAQDYIQAASRILLGSTSGGRLIPITDGVRVTNWAQSADGALQAGAGTFSGDVSTSQRFATSNAGSAYDPSFKITTMGVGNYIGFYSSSYDMVLATQGNPIVRVGFGSGVIGLRDGCFGFTSDQYNPLSTVNAKIHRPSTGLMQVSADNGLAVMNLAASAGANVYVGGTAGSANIQSGYLGFGIAARSAQVSGAAFVVDASDNAYISFGNGGGKNLFIGAVGGRGLQLNAAGLYTRNASTTQTNLLKEGGGLELYPQATTDKGLLIKSVASYAANYLELQDSTAAVKAKIDQLGSFTGANATFKHTTSANPGGLVIRDYQTSNGGYSNLEIAAPGWSVGAGLQFINHSGYIVCGALFQCTSTFGAQTLYAGVTGNAGAVENGVRITADTTNAYIYTIKYASSPYPPLIVSGTGIKLNTGNGAWAGQAGWGTTALELKTDQTAVFSSTVKATQHWETQSTAPTPGTNESATWTASGSGTKDGIAYDQGDYLITINVGGTSKTKLLADFSAM